ncbi:hypothetical protein GSI_11254 [Ganoderma sinense ZZ0214-1]|uniref:Uncharacterized protein n=1 Tax=Ganoderma sinense ZZ0214-1 TaxID=1077348 RepID=A0A2G8RZD8_9APHY|nr:hypothetical protein GSI_11254 [Ganoderma sinense ZZ0214-1]
MSPPHTSGRCVALAPTPAHNTPARHPSALRASASVSHAYLAVEGAGSRLPGRTGTSGTPRTPCRITPRANFARTATADTPPWCRTLPGRRRTLGAASPRGRAQAPSKPSSVRPRPTLRSAQPSSTTSCLPKTPSRPCRRPPCQREEGSRTIVVSATTDTFPSSWRRRRAARSTWGRCASSTMARSSWKASKWGGTAPRFHEFVHVCGLILAFPLPLTLCVFVSALLFRCILYVVSVTQVSDSECNVYCTVLSFLVATSIHGFAILILPVISAFA